MRRALARFLRWLGSALIAFAEKHRPHPMQRSPGIERLRWMLSPPDADWFSLVARPEPIEEGDHYHKALPYERTLERA